MNMEEKLKHFNSREELIEFIKAVVMDTDEAAEYLGVTKQRLSSLNKNGKVEYILKGIFLRSDVESRKGEQDDLRDKYYRR